MSVAVIILAAGRGERMRAGQNKVFLPLLGHPLLSYSLRIFASLACVQEIICVVRLGEERQVEHCIEQAGVNKKVSLVPGGETRQASVRAGLAAVEVTNDYVLIHDGARPLVSASLLTRLLKSVENDDAVIPAVPVKDTIKRVRAGEITQTLQRSELWAAQTPQAFRLDLIKRAYESDFAATDDASLVEHFHPVKIVEGEYQNIKITTPEDLSFAETVLRKGADLHDAYWARL